MITFLIWNLEWPPIFVMRSQYLLSIKLIAASANCSLLNNEFSELTRVPGFALVCLKTVLFWKSKGLDYLPHLGLVGRWNSQGRKQFRFTAAIAGPHRHLNFSFGRFAVPCEKAFVLVIWSKIVWFESFVKLPTVNSLLKCWPKL